MSCLLIGLPSEILLQISYYIRDPYDLDSWFMTSRLIYQLNTAYIRQHNYLTDRYGCIACMGEEYGNHYPTESLVRGTYQAKLVDLLREIVNGDTRIAPYVQVLIQAEDRNAEDEPDDELGWEETEEGQLLEDLLSQSPYFDSRNSMCEIVDWMSRFVFGATGPSLGILLTLLPNIQRLDLMNFEAWPFLLKPIHRIADDPGATALSMLTTVNLIQNDHPTPLAFLLAFASLPSLKTLTASSVITRPEVAFELEILDHFYHRQSRVIHLNLQECSLHPSILGPLFRFFVRLESLTFLERSPALDRVFSSLWMTAFDRLPASLDDALCHSASVRTLQALTFRTFQPSLVTTALKSLRRFELLKRLDIDLNVLVPGALRASDRANVVNRMVPDGYPVYETLADTLPPSIERVTIYDPTGEHDRRLRLLQRSLYPSKDSLQNLKQIHFELEPLDRAWELPWMLHAARDRQEVQIFVDKPKPRSSSRHIAPIWHDVQSTWDDDD